MNLCYDEPMKNTKIEPGLLRVFRLFALLRISVTGISYFFINYIPAINEQIIEDELFYYNTAPFFTIITMLMLLGYLSWPWMERKLGRSYLPIAVVLSTLWIIIEQYHYVSLLSIRAFQNLGHLSPFLYILLKLLA